MRFGLQSSQFVIAAARVGMTDDDDDDAGGDVAARAPIAVMGGADRRPQGQAGTGRAARSGPAPMPHWQRPADFDAPRCPFATSSGRSAVLGRPPRQPLPIQVWILNLEPWRAPPAPTQIAVPLTPRSSRESRRGSCTAIANYGVAQRAYKLGRVGVDDVRATVLASRTSGTRLRPAPVGSCTTTIGTSMIPLVVKQGMYLGRF